MNRLAGILLAVVGLTRCVGVVEELETGQPPPGGPPSVYVAPPAGTAHLVPPSTSKDITRFTVNGVDVPVTGTTLTGRLPWGTALGALVPTIEHTGVLISPASGTPQSFASPVVYTVTAEDGSTRSYTVTLSAEVDAIDLGTVTVFNSPKDIGAWPVTTQLTRITMVPSGQRDDGLRFVFSANATWPDYTPPGWDGPIQYTVWAVVKVNGQWYASGYIQMWRTRVATGAPLLTDFALNWAYDGRWGPMMGHNPVVGEQMGFFVTAGNARGTDGVTSVRERSNVVAVSLPAGDTGVFDF